MRLLMLETLLHRTPNLVESLICFVRNSEMLFQCGDLLLKRCEPTLLNALRVLLGPTSIEPFCCKIAHLLSAHLFPPKKHPPAGEMSSWANRRQIHRRDLHQIPEALRPAAPVPRAERPEVLLSESYQAAVEDSYPAFGLGSAGSAGMPAFNAFNAFNAFPTAFESRNPVHYPSEAAKPKARAKADPIPSGPPPLGPDAKELAVGGKSYVFVLLRHLRTAKDNELWLAAYGSIRKYYTNKIVIIDDNSAINTVNGKLYNTEILQSDYAGAGETLPYYYYLQYRWADRMIFLHDTMFLYRPFRPEEVDTDARFHWYFENKDTTVVHRLQAFLPSLRNPKKLADALDQGQPWRACFGVAMTVSLTVVQRIEEAYRLFSVMPMMIRNRRDREMAERLVGLVFFVEGIQQASTFGDIMAYPGAFQTGWPAGGFSAARYTLEQAGYDAALFKVWRGR